MANAAHWRAAALLALAWGVGAGPAAAQERAAAGSARPAPRAALPVDTRYREDLDGLLRRRTLRVLVVPNQTHYFLDRGMERGLSADAFKLFAERLNQGRAVAERIGVAFVPVERSEVLQALRDGRGDVADANLTVTAESARAVAFTAPIFEQVSEIVVTGPRAPRLEHLDDLAGQGVHVRRGTSEQESLRLLNERFRAAGKPLMRVVLLPDELETEDVLEMLDAGLIRISLIDSHLAPLWTQVFPRVRARADLAVREGAAIAWAVRADAPKLLRALNGFARGEYRDGSAARNIVVRRYLRDAGYVRGARGGAQRRAFDATVELFEKYGEQYGFDPLLLLAQAYQESRLDQSVRSPRGAIGIMQVTPRVGQYLGVGDIRKLEPNVHAGARYLRELADRFDRERGPGGTDRLLFAFAAYNAGPVRVARLRDEAERSGLDRNVWFRNVERIAARRIGRETVQYVRNIYQYYVAYKLTAEEIAERAAARESVTGALAARLAPS